MAMTTSKERQTPPIDLLFDWHLRLGALVGLGGPAVGMWVTDGAVWACEHPPSLTLNTPGHKNFSANPGDTLPCSLELA